MNGKPPAPTRHWTKARPLQQFGCNLSGKARSDWNCDSALGALDGTNLGSGKMLADAGSMLTGAGGETN